MLNIKVRNTYCALYYIFLKCVIFLTDFNCLYWLFQYKCIGKYMCSVYHNILWLQACPCIQVNFIQVRSIHYQTGDIQTITITSIKNMNTIYFIQTVQIKCYILSIKITKYHSFVIRIVEISYPWQFSSEERYLRRLVKFQKLKWSVNFQNSIAIHLV